MICSIAMSTYNGARFLEAQLDSLLAQTRPADEIIISDDASSDGTIEILTRYQAAHPEMHITLLPAAENQGFRASFRRAIRHCSGELIFCCDQDDVWAADKIERFERVFEENPQVLSLISDFRTIDAQGKPLCPEKNSENLWVSNRVMRAPDNPCKITLGEMLGRNQGQGCAMAVRRSVAQEYLAMDKVWTHDWILNLIAAMHGGLYFLKDQLLSYRLHGSNVIGMAQGEHANRAIPLLRKPYELALAFKYTFLEGNGEEARRNLNTVEPEKYDFVFSHIACQGEEAQALQSWQADQARRMALIARRKPVSYLLFFITHLRFFGEMAYFSTYEQVCIRLMMDLCALIKK